MKIISNVGDDTPGKSKKKSKTNVTKGTGKSQTTVELKIQPGSEKRKYTPSSAETGHPAYGKGGGTGSKLKPMLDKARAAGADVAHDKDGKPFRAGTTTVTKTPAKSTTVVNLRPHIPKPVQGELEKRKAASVQKKVVKSKPAKLKARAMTYGTDSPKKGGGTLYKRKVSPR
jgi:hypothetical protein